MDSARYLESLTLRLAEGLGQLGDDCRSRHAAFLFAEQRPDGGWAGREGESDLYYTGFALRSLAMLGRLDGEPARGAADFLRTRLRGEAVIVDFLSLVYGASLLELSAGLNVFAGGNPDWRTSVGTALEAFRRPDGGYAKGPEGHASSTYHSFLVVLCQQLIEVPTPEPARLAEFVLGQRREDGGFVEIGPMRRSGTNPTAAAVGLLRILDRVTPEIREPLIDFLLDMQNDEGGMRANTRIPVADLLSTFTALLTLDDLGELHQLEVGPAQRYVESLQRAEGGFHAADWDLAPADVEYTFYGLGCLGLLARLGDPLR